MVFLLIYIASLVIVLAFIYKYGNMKDYDGAIMAAFSFFPMINSIFAFCFLVIGISKWVIDHIDGK